MQPVYRASLVITAAAAIALSAARAQAHIDLLEPEARAHGTAARGDTDIDANSNLKQAPCGQVTTGRTQRVARYTAGQTMTVRVREENAHVSYLRVSLDLDGEDFPLRSGPVVGPETQEVAAAAEAALGGEGLLAVYREDNDTPGFVHEIDVTLPEQTCTNCTLQVIQYMYDDPSAPYYFQCADLVIVGAGEGEDDGAGALSPVGPVARDAGALAPEASEPPGGGTDVSSEGAPASPNEPSGVAAPTPAGAAPGTISSSERSATPSDGGCDMARRVPGSLRSAGVCLLALAIALAYRRS
jgi:hypothetical protein